MESDRKVIRLVCFFFTKLESVLRGDTSRNILLIGISPHFFFAILFLLSMYAVIGHLFDGLLKWEEETTKQLRNYVI